ncbi:hypothetical protein GTW98_04845 [Streptomyces sp. SID8375]|uniref:hypothetical protein n=1 Tax=Streptomyces TaxID=1883 RepID=UPI00035EAD5D|nr:MULTISPECIES: hypothetical protein [unclassified Streptomyces]MYT16920.1 hypothetical protein [Streptomyces sp. SID4951]MYX06140.1 hypothetical protein [Streptomyces sp. SID8375]SCK35983.1 hypothetical protein YWIDRAFT_06498 [Streptomyces sp. SceaMP-e96]
MKTTWQPQALGLGHWSHPLLGERVVDHAHGDRVGVFRALAPDAEATHPGPVLVVPDTPPVAWLSPEGGGVEWTTGLDTIEAVR